VSESTMRRQRRQRLTDKQVASLPREAERYLHPDPEMPGHGVRVYPAGPSAFYVVVRDAFKKQRWVRLGGTAEMSIEQSRERARTVIGRLQKGLEPFEPPPVKPDTVADVVANWLRRHVKRSGLRTGDELQRVLERHVLPVWADHPFAGIRRSDIAGLLDAVEDKHGPWVADSVLGALRSVASWYATRHDTYVPPFTKKMRRVPTQNRKRARILFDDELRRAWRAAEADDGPFGAFVRVLLLTAQRREKVASMKWDDVAPDGTWTIPTEAREKGNPGTLKLPLAAMAIINAQPRFASNPHVFAGRDDGPITRFSHWHAAFRKRCGVDGWTLHDLRRTARSLLSRTDVRPDIAERCLGHTVGGAIAQTYDRHNYATEIADALQQLAALIATIVRGKPGDNVVPMPMRAPTVRP
jgi:integrase